MVAAVTVAKQSAARSERVSGAGVGFRFLRIANRRRRRGFEHRELFRGRCGDRFRCNGRRNRRPRRGGGPRRRRRSCGRRCHFRFRPGFLRFRRQRDNRASVNRRTAFLFLPAKATAHRPSRAVCWRRWNSRSTRTFSPSASRPIPCFGLDEWRIHRLRRRRRGRKIDDREFDRLVFLQGRRTESAVKRGERESHDHVQKERGDDRPPNQTPLSFRIHSVGTGKEHRAFLPGIHRATGFSAFGRSSCARDEKDIAARNRRARRSSYRKSRADVAACTFRLRGKYFSFSTRSIQTSIGKARRRS